MRLVGVAMTIEETKEFIMWCKTQGIAAITVGDVSVTFNPVAPTFDPNFIKELTDQEQYEKELFHSAGGA